MEKNVEFIARGLAFQNGKILLCKRKDRDYYFFPGGHIEFGEFAGDALKREIKEEIGINAKIHELMGMLENVFKDKGSIFHEVNFVFRIEVDEQNVKSLEDHLEFCWMDYNDFLGKTVLPTALKKQLLKRLEIKKDDDEIKSNYFEVSKDYSRIPFCDL
jgi:8-oxo-dGTP diphosphatase